MAGGDPLGGPDHLPSGEHIRIHQLPLEVQEEPPVTKVEVGVVAVGVHQLVHLRVEDLYERPHVGKVAVHRVAVGEVLHHPLHHVTEAGVGQALVVEDDQEGGDQIAHALHVTDVQVFPDVTTISFVRNNRNGIYLFEVDNSTGDSITGSDKQ